jgi:hypothetical protein
VISEVVMVGMNEAMNVLVLCYGGVVLEMVMVGGYVVQVMEQP